MKINYNNYKAMKANKVDYYMNLKHRTTYVFGVYDFYFLG